MWCGEQQQASNSQSHTIQQYALSDAQLTCCKLHTTDEIAAKIELFDKYSAAAAAAIAADAKFKLRNCSRSF